MRRPRIFRGVTVNRPTPAPATPPPVEEHLTVRGLVAFLLTQDQDLPVAYSLYSEQTLMKLDDIGVYDLCLPRNDGWVQSARPDMPTRRYLVFPGN